MPAGITTVDFGANAAPTAGALTGIEDGDAVVTVTGQTSILSGSIVDAWIVGVATADHTAEEHMIENLRCVAGNIVASTSFDIRISPTKGPVYGLFSVAWAWQ